MKKLVLAGLFALSATIANADPLEGIWKTEVDDGNYGHIKISACGPAFCGIIHKSFNATGEFVSENKGKKLVIDMMPQGEGEYEGSVWRPSNDKIYYGTIRLRCWRSDLFPAKLDARKVRPACTRKPQVSGGAK
jgi:uncharacterized protein (DUF2147 family)